MEPILKQKLNVVSLDRFSEDDQTIWKIQCESAQDYRYLIHAEYHDWMLHVHLEETTNPKVISRIELRGGTKILYIQYLFDHDHEHKMENEEFRDIMNHLFVFN